MEYEERKDYVTLREYIKSGKGKSFLKLMKNVDLALAKEHDKGLAIVNINLDQISINPETEEIVFPVLNKYDPLEKTIAGIKTGVGINSERKSTFDHNETSLALMILGWYVNPDHSSIESDMTAVENYEEYRKKVPTWIDRYFEDRFKRMGTTRFSNYYDENFVNKINKDISSLELNPQDQAKFNKNIIQSINSNIKTLLFSSRISKDDVFGFYEQYALDNYEKNFGTTKNEERSSSGPGQSLVKTLYKPGTEGMYAEDDIMYRAENIGNKPNAAYATAIALALVGCLTMIVSVVSFIIFSKLF